MPTSPKFAPALQSKLDAGEGLLNVEIEFSEPPPANEVDVLGLQREGKQAWGWMNRDRIAALASIPQVASVRLSSRPTPAPPREPGGQIGTKLQLDMLLESEDSFRVSVTFREPVKDPGQFPDLAIFSDVGTGALTREQIQELARRDDVLSIEALVPPEPL
jgi:hypothetical protein